MNYKFIWVLVDGSLEVFLLYFNGELYGVIQKGEYEFYGEELGKFKYLISMVKFIYVWIFENGVWKLKWVLSYDYVVL